MRPRRAGAAALRCLPRGAGAAGLRFSPRRGVVAALLCALGCAAAAEPACAQQPAPSPPVVIDGPSAAIALPAGLGLSVARDGTGGLVYVKQIGGAEHVFVSPLIGGSFQLPVQVDTTLPAGSSSPVIAAGKGGLLLVAFLSGGQLFAVQKASSGAAFGAPRALVSGASSPSISITNFPKAYLAFTVPDGSGYDVRAAYWVGGSWSLEPSPLNVSPADDAGAGTGAPSVSAAGDGVATVAWGENGGVYTRRVWGTAPSTVYERADGAPSGCSEVSADDPAVGTEGDSSWVPVAFHEQVSCGGIQQSRVLMNRLQASAYDGVTAVDGLSGASTDGADDPRIAVGEYGHGFVTSERTTSHDVYATALGDNSSTLSTSQVNGSPEAAAPDPVPAIAGLSSELIAWQQSPGSGGLPEIRVRYSPGGAGVLGPEMVVSSAGQGAADAADGLVADGDLGGDAAIAWVQQAPGGGGAQIVAARLYQPPGAPVVPAALQYRRRSRPVLGWAPGRAAWGPITYTVTVDGSQVAQTSATSVTLPTALADGPHTWQVTAANPAGQQSESPTATVFVDTVPPTVSAHGPGRVRLGAPARIRIAYGDAPPAGGSGSDASGVSRVIIRWGDGSKAALALGAQAAAHTYDRAGVYEISVVVTDRAGNAATAAVRVRVVSPKPRHHSKGRSR